MKIRYLAFWAFVAVFLVMAGCEAGHAAQEIAPNLGVESSGLLTQSGIVHTGRCSFAGVEIITDGANAATVIVYDNTAASGTVLFKGVVLGAAQFGNMLLTWPIRARTGIYVSIAGVGANAIVQYKAE